MLTLPGDREGHRPLRWCWGRVQRSKGTQALLQDPPMLGEERRRKKSQAIQSMARLDTILSLGPSFCDFKLLQQSFP